MPGLLDWAQTTWPVRLAQGVLSAAMLPGDVYSGRTPITDASGHTSQDVINRSADLAGLAMSGTGFSAPADALGAGPVIPGITPKPTYTSIPDIAPQSLRDRYWYELYHASGGKDVNRIKLTPERIAAAADEIKNRGDVIADPYVYTTQGKQAVEFAKSALQQNNDVAVKYPDGPMGSVYVRVGDKGTVRFADHPSPTDANGVMIGGYSKTLGRRHGPASLSVAPYDMTPADALNWLNGRFL